MPCEKREGKKDEREGLGAAAWRLKRDLVGLYRKGLLLEGQPSPRDGSQGSVYAVRYSTHWVISPAF